MNSLMVFKCNHLGLDIEEDIDVIEKEKEEEEDRYAAPTACGI